MKKFLVVLGTMVAFSLVGAALDIVLGITFPSFGASVVHNVLFMVNGTVLWLVLDAKI